jgi:hypothetical protein
VKPSDTKFEIKIVKWRSNSRICAAIIDRICADADFGVTPCRKIDVVEIPHCEILKLYRVKVIGDDPMPRTVANVVLVFQYVLAIVASVIDEFDEASKNSGSKSCRTTVFSSPSLKLRRRVKYPL